MMPKPAYYPVLFLLIPWLFGSCATILNSPVQTIRIATDTSIRHMEVVDCVKIDSVFHKHPAGYIVKRENTPLVIHLYTDTGQRTVLLRPRSSFMYWFNIYCNYGIGMLVDKDNPKRYGYPVYNYFTAAGPDTVVRRRRLAPAGQGLVRFSAAVSFINVFDLKTPGRRDYPGGILGLEAGADYFYRDNHYLSLAAGAGSNATPMEYAGTGFRTFASSLYVNVANNHVVGSFDFAYGLSFSRLRWKRQSYGMIPAVDSLVSGTGLGFCLSAAYRLGKYSRIGVLYQPTVLSTYLSPAFNYQHYISVRFAWKLPLNKPKR